MTGLTYEHFLGNDIKAFSSDAHLDFLKSLASPTQPFQLTAPQRAMLTAGGIRKAVIFPKQVHGDIIWEVSPEDMTLTEIGKSVV